MAKGNGYCLTQGQYAKRRGISQPAVAKLIRHGKLAGAFKKQGGRYLINPEKADAILESIANPDRAGKPADPPAVAAGGGPGDPARAVAGELVSFAEATRREKLAKAALLELKLKRQRGELVERHRVEAVAAKLATLVRIQIEAIPAKVAPTVAGMKTPGDVARLLQVQFKEVLNNLSEGIAKLDL
jgi:hypothetical protein